MAGQNRQVGEHVRKTILRCGPVEHKGRIVGRRDAREVVKLGLAGIADGGIAGGVESPPGIARGCRNAIVPVHALREVEGELFPIG
jgi:hypothetical protein